MARSSIGVAVIGAGMAGRAHAAGYRSATTVYGDALPGVRLVAIADVNAEFGADAARRFGYERSETNWQAIADAADIDAVSVVVANPLHREIVEGLLEAGKHVPCEKPLAPASRTRRPWSPPRPPRRRRPRSASPSAARRRSTRCASSSATPVSAGPCTSTATIGATTRAIPAGL